MFVPAFFLEYQGAFLFYIILILIIIYFRNKIEWQTFGIGLYKTKIGLKLMERLGTKYRGLVQVLGYTGVGVGFVGMTAISYMLLFGFWKILVDPTAPAVVSPVIPGFPIPGVGITIPLITGWLALFVVIVIHEFSHGVVSRAHNIPVKSSGLLVFGPIAGAFVEPDEKKMMKEHESVQYALFAAGPFSNILMTLLVSLVSAFIIIPLITFMTIPSGIQIDSVTDNYGADNASIEAGMIVLGINNVETVTQEEMSKELDKISPGEVALVKTNRGEYAVTTTQHPNNEASRKGYLGVNLKQKYDPKYQGTFFAGLLYTIQWIKEFFYWIMLLNLGIGLANLLPLGPVDGGRMLQTACRQIVGDTKRGDWWWKKISIFTLIFLLIALLVPLIRAIL